uniref:Uncharacterized protein n=1 Tax=Clastoptera arizonana TaxID=38151 RepID=A0A1B6E169_9HEMI
MLSGKIALITGGGSGIGRATCEVVARERAYVVVADKVLAVADETVKLLPGNNHISIYMDVSNESSVENAFKAIVYHYNAPPTLVVNSAGCGSMVPPLGITKEQLYEVFDVNVMGTLNVCQLISKELIKNKSQGSIVNVGSIVTNKVLIPSSLGYNASKAVVEQITRAFAGEMAKYNIRFNVVLPGFIDTPLLRQATTPDIINNLVSSCAFERLGKPHGKSCYY